MLSSNSIEHHRIFAIRTNPASSPWQVKIGDRRRGMDELIYQRPADYELEHDGDTEDVEFFVGLARQLKPKRVLELACGSGRVTQPLATLAAQEGFDIVGLDNATAMLSEARRRYDAASQQVRDRLTLLEGDMRHWDAVDKFDLIVSPCGSMAHLLTLQDQLDAWKHAYDNLSVGGEDHIAIGVGLDGLHQARTDFKTGIECSDYNVLQKDRDRHNSIDLLLKAPDAGGLDKVRGL
jgi:SAM-dependent methyltransferase